MKYRNKKRGKIVLWVRKKKNVAVVIIWLCKIWKECAYDKDDFYKYL